MDITPIIDPLNPAQREAVCAREASALVLAGAGSGKTRVLVHRAAWLILAENVPAQSILAVTFTNKAAREMKTRIESLLGLSTQNLWIGTFHGLAHRLLRRHAKEVGLPENFQILDSDDQQRVIKRIIRSEGLDDARWPPRQVQWYINSQKEEGRRARDLRAPNDPFEKQMIALYHLYEAQCERSALVDFSELLLRALELFMGNLELLEFYQQKFRHVLVDEFQDTNRIQYQWLHLLTSKNQNLFVVGDDDQSIYSWRGARVDHLDRFRGDYPNHQMVRLEQNYRSTGTILAAANALIRHNSARLGKELWTQGDPGEMISLYAAFNEQDEAHFVVRQIQSWSDEGQPRQNCAILYRSNAQSRQFEEKLVALGIPYRVHGGLRFFERQEIKDALAYLRMTHNPEDDASFERIVNTPPRGIGDKTLERVREITREEGISMWKATRILIDDAHFPARSRGALKLFMDLILALGQKTQELSLSRRALEILTESGLMDHYRKERGDLGEQRVENLEELVNATRQFEQEADLDPSLSIEDQFLAHAALEAGESGSNPQEDCVQLMTLHASKGLEFDLVFIVGLEDGLFPSLQSIDDSDRLEEERRLCYVGVTRARKRLILCYAESRRLFGRESYPRPSRFLREIPGALIAPIRLGGMAMPRPTNPSSATQSLPLFRIGQQVEHPKFGIGVILQAEGEDNQARVQINFRGVGIKWLMLSHALLTAVES